MVHIEQIDPSQIPEVQTMIREYLAWAKSLDDDSERAPTFHAVDDELQNLPGIYTPPKGRLLVATVDGSVAGCVALKPHEGELCELKRLYVRPQFRGHNLGRLLVEKLIQEARSSGYEKMILDSHHTMQQAHNVYRSLGFVDVAAPDDFPEDMKSIAIFMERSL